MPCPASARRARERLFLIGILAGALVIRLVHFLTIVGTAYPKFPFVFDESDMHTFLEWAQAILAGDWWGRDTYHPYFDWMKTMAPKDTWYRWWGGKEIFQQAPLYPYVVAGLLGVARDSLAFVLAVQLVLGAFQPLVIFFLARRLFDGRVAVLAAGLTAFYGPFVFHEGVLLRDWIPPVLEPLALLALLRARASGRARDWGLSGAVLGIALLTREAVLIFIPVALLWLILGYRGAMTKGAVSSVALLLGLLLAVSPLLARNAVVGAPLLALSNRAGEAFIVGNAADGFPIGLTHPPSMKTILERSDGRTAAVVLETLRTYHGNWRRFVDFQLLSLRGSSRGAQQRQLLLRPGDLPSAPSHPHVRGDLPPGPGRPRPLAPGLAASPPVGAVRTLHHRKPRGDHHRGAIPPGHRAGVDRVRCGRVGMAVGGRSRATGRRRGHLREPAGGLCSASASCPAEPDPEGEARIRHLPTRLPCRRSDLCPRRPARPGGGGDRATRSQGRRTAELRRAGPPGVAG